MALLTEMPSVVVVHRKRRGIELAMVLFAQALGIGAYALVHLNQGQPLPDDLPFAAGAWVALGLVASALVVSLRGLGPITPDGGPVRVELSARVVGGLNLVTGDAEGLPGRHRRE